VGKAIKCIFYALLILMCNASWLKAQNTVFDRKKQEYLNTEGAQFKYFHERTWAWLEKIKTGQINPSTYRIKDIDGVEKPILDVLHNIIRCWGNQWRGEDWLPTYDTAWRWAEWYTSVTCIWILLKYGDIIYPDDKTFLTNLYNNYIRERDFSPGSENSRLDDMVGRYLYSQYHKDVQVQYSYYPPPNTNIYEFSYGGRTYTPGSVYSAYELSRDWLYCMMDTWVFTGNAELDSPCYTWLFILSFTAVYEMAVDPVMKNKAKMMLDFMLLESVLDFSANQWGGALGRTYIGTIYGGDSRFYWNVFWDELPPSHEPSMAVQVSSYRLPDVIYDIGDLRDEPDNYYHINMEYNWNIVWAPKTGKWNYVTKFFNLGGKIGGGWQLNVKSMDPIWWNPKRPGLPFRLFINGTAGTGDISQPVSYEAYSSMGGLGYQYKNAMFCKGAELHYAIGDNKWDIDLKDPPWEFFKEGRTMIAVQCQKFGQQQSSLELAIEGVDYTSFDDFKNAVKANAYLSENGYTTSKGDAIQDWQIPNTYDRTAVVQKNGEKNFQYVWPFPFMRIQTQDWRGEWIVRWSANKMIVTKHGVQSVYDFNTWTVQEGTASTDTQAPAPPTGVSVVGKISK